MLRFVPMSWLVLFAEVALAQEPEPPPLVPPALLAPIVVSWPASEPPERGVQAVDLDLLVAEDGSVEEIVVVAGEAPFTDLAVAAAKAASLSPATEGGTPVAVHVPLHLQFTPPALSVEGHIVLAGSGAPAVGLPVRVGDAVGTTDAEGRFRLYGLPDGTYDVVITDPRVWIAPRSVEVRLGEVVVLELMGRPETDAGIVATYRRPQDEVQRRTLDAETVRVIPGSLGDPLRAVQDLPGTVRSPLDTGWLLVRGGDPRDTGVYIDGVRVPLVYHLGGFTSVLNPGLIDRVEFIPGGQPARYGRATAGAVDVVTKGTAEPWELRGGANLVFAGVLGGAKLGPVQASVGVRRSYLDGVLALIPGITPEQASIAPRFWDWQARVDGERWTVFGLGYDDTIDASDATGQPVKAHLATHRLHGATSLDLGARTLDVRPYVAWEEERFELATSDFDDTRTTWNLGARIESLDPGDGRFGWGAGLDTDVLNYTVDVGTAARSAWVGSPEPWVEARVGTAERRLVGGVRLDTVFVEDQTPRWGASPRLAGRWGFGDGWAIRADAGMYHQPPSWSALIGPPEGGVFGLESSYGGGLGVQARIGPVEVDLGGYGRKIDGIVGFEDDGSLDQEEGRAYGVESMTRLTLGRFFGWVSASYSRSERKEDADIDRWKPGDFDQPLSITAIATLDLGRRWSLATRWRYASGFPEPDSANAGAYDVFTSQNVPLDGDASGRLEPFHTLDLKVAKRFLLRRGTVDFWLDVQNVYNRRVPEPVILGLTQFPVTDAYAFGLPILPIFGVEVQVAGKPR